MIASLNEPQPSLGSTGLNGQAQPLGGLLIVAAAPSTGQPITPPVRRHPRR